MSEQLIFKEPLQIIKVAGGDIVKFIQNGGEGYSGFGELYFSNVDHGAIKAWKCHKQMSMNLTVTAGRVKFVFFDAENKTFREELLSGDQPMRLLVPPSIWYGFQGMELGTNLIVSFSDMRHSENEVQRKDVEQIPYEWK